jgi:hypothetical protein
MRAALENEKYSFPMPLFSGALLLNRIVKNGLFTMQRQTG